MRDNLANNSGSTASTDTGTDSVSDPRLGSFSVLVDGSSSGSGSRNSLSVVVDGSGSGGGSGDRLLDIPGRLDRLSFARLDVGSGPGGGSSKVGVVGPDRGDLGRRSTDSPGVRDSLFVLIVPVGRLVATVGSLVVSV